MRGGAIDGEVKVLNDDFFKMSMLRTLLLFSGVGVNPSGKVPPYSDSKLDLEKKNIKQCFIN